MEAPLISVIVPVYKVEKYLDRCVQSIVDQTYRNLEIILVDDGSPDNCGAMCDAWAAKDDRIKVIHKENGGLSDARNAGMVVAAGEYIAFVDSDDWVDKCFVEILYGVISKNACDMAEGRYITTTGDMKIPESSGNIVVYDTDEAMALHLNNSMFLQVVWNKLYRRDVLTVPFEKGKYHEDEFWTYQIIHNCCKLAHIDRKLYYYFQRSDSIMGEKYSLKRLDVVEALAQKKEFIKKNYPLLYNRYDTKLYFTCLYHGQLALRNLNKEDQMRAFAILEQTVDNYVISREEINDIKLTHKCWIALAKRNFKLCCKIRNLLGIGL